jgi:hypothetical protein
VGSQLSSLASGRFCCKVQLMQLAFPLASTSQISLSEQKGGGRGQASIYISLSEALSSLTPKYVCDPQSDIHDQSWVCEL